MAYKYFVMVVLLAGLSGCASLEQTAWNVQKNLREPGEKLLALPDDVWEQYACDQKPLPFVAIEANELLPPRLDPGDEFNHRLVYALCTNPAMEEIVGALYTRIYRRGQPYAVDVADSYPLRPGRWQVNTFITLPPDIEQGVYGVELDFRSDALSFQERQNFVVQ